jgi:hypothetical protein
MLRKTNGIMQTIKETMAFRKGLVIGMATGALTTAFTIFYLFI